MTVLTWRDVATPDFRGTQEGFEASARALSQGFGAVRGAIDDIKQDKVANQSAAVLAEAAKYQNDPAKLQADLASGAFQSKFDMRYVDPNILKTVMDRPNQILETAAKQSAFNEAQKGIADSDYMRTNAKVFNGALVARRQGDDAYKAYYEQNKDILEGASGNMFRNFLENEQEISSGDLSRQGTQLSQLITSTNFRNAEDDRAVQLKADELGGALGGMTPDNRLKYLNDNRKELVDAYGIRAVNRVLGQYQGDYGAPAGGGGGTGGIGAGGKNVYDVLLGDGQGAGGGNLYGFNPGKPVSSMTMGELFDYQRSTMVPTTAAKGVGKGQGSSAAGAYQIVSKTLERVAPQVFGDNWRSMKFDATAQDKLGEALFNEAKANGTDLHAVWEGLPVGTSPKGKTWATIRDKITRAESGGVTNGRDLALAADVTNQMNELSPLGQAAITFQERKGDRRAPREIANDLNKRLGLDEDVGNLTQEIRRIADRNGITFSMAAYALETRGDNGNKSWFKRLANPFPGSDGLKMDIDDDALDAFVAQLKDPKTLADATIGVRAGRESQAANAQSEALIQSIKTQIKTKEDVVARTGAQDPSLNRLYAQLGQAMSARDTNAVAGARTAATGQMSRTGEDGVPDPAPAQRRRTAPPPPLAKGPAPGKKPGMMLAEAAAANADAPWAKKALAAAAATKPLTAQEFAAMMKAQGKKLPLSR